MIRPADEEETAMVRESLEAVHRGLFENFLSGKRLAIVEESPSAGDQVRHGDTARNDAHNKATHKTARGAAGSANGGDAASIDGDADPSGDAAAGEAAPTNGDADPSGDAAAGEAAPTNGDAASKSGAAPTGPSAPRRVVLVDAAVLALPPGLLADASSGGLHVGIIDDGFALDLQGAVIMARETRRQAIRVNEKASRLFLYGRSILGTSILAFDPSLRFGDHCIVTNPRHEALGIGVVVGSFKGARTAVDAVHDLGSYLRDE